MVARVTRESTDGPIPPQSAVPVIVMTEKLFEPRFWRTQHDTGKFVSASCPQGPLPLVI